LQTMLHYDGNDSGSDDGVAGDGDDGSRRRWRCAMTAPGKKKRKKEMKTDNNSSVIRDKGTRDTGTKGSRECKRYLPACTKKKKKKHTLTFLEEGSMEGVSGPVRKQAPQQLSRMRQGPVPSLASTGPRAC
jgi:hypothetical protein